MIRQIDEQSGDKKALGLSSPGLSYVDLRVRIHALDETAGAYPVEAWITDIHGSISRVGGAYFSLDVSHLADSINEPEVYGQHLFYSLFSGAMASVYDRSMGLAEASADSRLRLHLWISDNAPELHALIWERMHHQRAGIATPIAAVARTPFSRFIDVDFPVSEPEPFSHLRLLYACANPVNLQSHYGLTPMDVDTEIQRLLTSLLSLRHTHRLSVTIMPGISGISSALRTRIDDMGWVCHDGPSSVAEVVKALAGAPGYQILHFLGHGRFSQRDAAATLYFEGKSGNAHIVKDTDLGAYLRGVSHVPELVFLAACESAKRHPDLGYPQVGFAPQLIRAGVKAVVAMQDQITTLTARQLTTDFYQAVLDHGIVDLALNQARFAIHADDQRDWWVPVLSTMLPDGVLFKPNPLRSMLDAMADADVFNPLPSNADYIPCEVRYIRNHAMLRGQRVTGYGPIEIRRLFDQILGIPGDDHSPLKTPAPIVVLSGARGMGKSVQLKRLGHLTAIDARHADRGAIALPVFLDLAENPQEIQTLHSLERRYFNALHEIQTDLKRETAYDWLGGKGPVLRFLIDGLDALNDSERKRIWRLLANFIFLNPRHQYVLAYHDHIEDLEVFSGELEAAGVPDRLEIVQIQPLSERTLTEFLTRHSSAGALLARVIVEKKLTRVAAHPWVLMNLLDSARRNDFPDSMTALVRDLLFQAISRITSDPGIRDDIVQGLSMIAFEMHSRSDALITVDKVFAMLRDIRASRTYDLERVFSSLCEVDVLSTLNGQDVRFTRDIFQAYCVALAILDTENSQTLVEDISITMGTRFRIQWWSGVFIFLAGSGFDVNHLLQTLLFSNNLRSSELLILAARITQEGSPELLDHNLRSYVIQSLIKQIESGIEKSVTLLLGLIDALAGFRHAESLPHLVDIVTDAASGSTDSRICMQAVEALRRLDGPEFELVARHNKTLAGLLRFREQEDVAALAQYVISHDRGQEDTTDLRSVAVFALADLHTETAFSILEETFVHPDTDAYTLSSVCLALAQMDPLAVINRVIVPYINASSVPPGVFSRLDDSQFQRLKVYVIELMRAMQIGDEQFTHFIRDTLLHDVRIENKVEAIKAIGDLLDREMKPVLESIVLQDVSMLDIQQPLTNMELLSLQMPAIAALSEIGDRETLDQLTPVVYREDLGYALYEMTEAILRRERAGF